MEEKKKVPELRFPGFEDDWEEKKLGDIVSINPKVNNMPPEFIYIDLESVISGILIQKNYINLADAPSRAQRVLSKGDILFQMVRPYQKNNYFFDLNDSKIKYVASTGYAQIRTVMCSKFFYCLFHTTKFVNEVINKCTGTSYPAINSTDLGAIDIFQTIIPEQTKIANFLSDIDLKIEKLTKKKELMVQYKKGMMQTLFSQEIRFKDENGNEYPDWEEKRLGDVFISRNEIGDFYDLPLFSLTIKKGVIAKPERYIREQLIKAEKNSYKKIYKGDFVFNPMNLRFGAIKAYKGNKPVRVSKYYDTFYTKGSTVFWEHYLTTYNALCYYDRMATGSLVEKKRVHYLEFIKFKFLAPSEDEQTKIANFLTNLDKKIKQIDKELCAIKEFKKGLLQKMFV